MNQRPNLTWLTFKKTLYVVMGILIVIHSVLQHQWITILFGGYFVSLGIFAFGCAAGRCNGGNGTVELTPKDNTKILEYSQRMNAK